jgi:hypothetical protein
MILEQYRVRLNRFAINPDGIARFLKLEQIGHRRSCFCTEKREASVKPSITEEEFAFLVRRAELPLTDAQKSELYKVYGFVEQMVARVRTPRDRAAEPAHIFVFESEKTRG